MYAIHWINIPLTWKWGGEGGGGGGEGGEGEGSGKLQGWVVSKSAQLIHYPDIKGL